MKQKILQKDIFFTILIMVVIGIIILPMIIYGENYYFTIHDYIEFCPATFQMLRDNGLFWAIDSPMPILNGMLTCYIYFDYGIFRLMNYFFGFIWGGIIIKIIGLGLGVVCMSKLLNYLFEDNLNKYIKTLMALAYAITPVYPIWTCSFAVLPLCFYYFLRYIKNPKAKLGKEVLLGLLFGLFVYFPSLGIFVLMAWCVGILYNLIKDKCFNKSLFVSLIFMGISSVLTNLNVILYILRGDEINRALNKTEVIGGIWQFVLAWAKALLAGQYHAAPNVHLVVVPFCFVIAVVMVVFLICKQKRNAESVTEFVSIIKKAIVAFAFLVLFAFIYAVDDCGYLALLGKSLPILSGFNFGRFLSFNNVIWYILLGYVILYASKQWKKVNAIIYVILILQMLAIIVSNGKYQDTYANLNREESKNNPELVTYAEYFDTQLFQEIKTEIDYNGEGVISLGINPAVALYNGYHTLDGYFSINSMEYHDAFRRIIAPTLEQNETLRERYDYGGIRLFAYLENSNEVFPNKDKMVQEKDALIDTTAFGEMGGKYIISRFRLTNIEELNLELILEKNDEDSIYHLFVYQLKDMGE
ncbi:MAG: hypothetical protein IJZ44_06905 [Lachnospiraceae bacterium]|nr:hypothetical protein [Lachnospiraceae bacterium]